MRRLCLDVRTGRREYAQSLERRRPFKGSRRCTDDLCSTGEKDKSIGVFVWTRFSAMDRETPSGTIVTPRLKNVTAIA